MSARTFRINACLRSRSALAFAVLCAGRRSVTQAELVRLGWTVMFGCATIGALYLLWAFVKDRVDLGDRNGVLRAQADSTVSDGVVILLGALAGSAAAVASWYGWQLVALASLMALGFFYTLMILNMLRGRRAVTRSLKLTVDRLEEVKAKARSTART